MRISDWSSDVCSSDLSAKLPYRKDLGSRGATRPSAHRHRRPRRPHRRSGGWPETVPGDWLMLSPHVLAGWDISLLRGGDAMEMAISAGIALLLLVLSDRKSGRVGKGG